MKFIKGLLSLVIAVVILAGAVAGAGWIWLGNEVAKDGPLPAETLVVVEPGEGMLSVAARLEKDGVIRSAWLMRLKARIDGTETALKTGEFTIEPQASLGEVLEILIEGKAVMHKITLPEGRTTAQLLRLIESDPVLVGPMPELPVAEGSLLPDTYLYHRGMTRAKLIVQMAKAQDELLKELWPKRQDGLLLANPYEAVILASVVEKETGIAEERPEVAALFTTRMKRGMRLESDPTIIYGISQGEPLYNKAGERRTLYRSEIDRKTDWNTYQIDGLPKTPICNPGRDAIAAVLNPPETEYIFFVADGKGGHLFAKTLAEHNRNVAAYRKYEREEIARERAEE
ncbi:endolytic transglycosylase MltG [Hyphomonas sp.]|uniref:endolytic transglycosylase MltG n=1 Tax=Hyphomonas sp. TaxID=87 RepID=UPI003563DB66